MKTFLCSIFCVAIASVSVPAAPADDGKLRIICFGAHPDDCELQAGGVAAMWSAKGHHVKLVSVMLNIMSALMSAFAVLFLFWTITAIAKKIAVKSG